MKKKIIYLVIVQAITAIMPLCGKPRELIRHLKITPHRVSITIDKRFSEKYLHEDVFFAEYERDINLTKVPKSIVLMPFIMNVISLVWVSGKEYIIDCLDYDLSIALDRLHLLLKKMYPKIRWNGKLIARKLEHNKLKAPVDPSKETAVLFSGGLDSIVSSLRHEEKKQVFITAWGNSDFPPDRRDLWEDAYDRLNEFAKMHGHKLSIVRSNFWFILNRKYLDHEISPEITSWRLDTVEGLGWAGLAAPILYAKNQPILRIASSISWKFPAKIASAPIFDDTISFAGIQAVQDAFEMTRIEKFEFLRDYFKKHHLSKPDLRVCNSFGGENCNRCIKCLQTISELKTIGEPYRKYGFDISPYHLYKRMHGKVKHVKYSKRRVWHFWMLQKRLREMIAQGKKLDKYLLWLAHAKINYKPEINWRTFMSRFPWYNYHAFHKKYDMIAKKED